MRTWLVLACVALATALPLPALAQDTPDVALSQARELILYARYPDAIAAAEELLGRSDLTAEQRNGVLELLATAQLASRQTDAARRTLETLYTRDPQHRLSDPDASPPVVSAFARAREAQPTPLPVVLEHRSPGTLPRRESPTIVVHVDNGADAIGELRLSYRVAGDAGYSQVVMSPRGPGEWAGRIPVLGSSERPQDVAYFVQAFAPSGFELAHVGVASAPLQLRIPAEVPDPRAVALGASTSRNPLDAEAPTSGGGSVFEEPWFWIVVGVLVAGGVTAGVVVGTMDSGPEQGTLGTVTLMR